MPPKMNKIQITQKGPKRPRMNEPDTTRQNQGNYSVYAGARRGTFVPNYNAKFGAVVIGRNEGERLRAV